VAKPFVAAKFFLAAKPVVVAKLVVVAKPVLAATPFFAASSFALGEDVWLRHRFPGLAGCDEAAHALRRGGDDGPGAGLAGEDLEDETAIGETAADDQLSEGIVQLRDQSGAIDARRAARRLGLRGAGQAERDQAESC
jgi:hypothetical protein